MCEDSLRRKGLLLRSVAGMFYNTVVEQRLTLCKEDGPSSGDDLVGLVVGNIRLGGVCKHFRALYVTQASATQLFTVFLARILASVWFGGKQQ